MSSGSAEPRDILDAAEEGVAMIVGVRERKGTPVGGVTTACRMQNRGSMIVIKRRHYCVVVEVDPSLRTIFSFAPVFLEQ